MSTDQKLQKEIDRLTKALGAAQALNAGLERDKDRAWELVQLVLGQLPGRKITIPVYDVMFYKPDRCTVKQERDDRMGELRLELVPKK